MTCSAPVCMCSKNTLRAVCAAIINRVCQEHPHAATRDLVTYLHRANPFAGIGVADAIWAEELQVTIGAGACPQERAFLGTAMLQ